MRDKFKLFACMLALGGLSLVGCGDDDDGTVPGVDAGGVDASGGDSDGGGEDVDAGGGGTDLPVATIEGGAAPDFSCVGQRTAPTAGGPISFTAMFTGVPAGTTIPNGTAVEFFPGNAVTTPCAAPGCVSAMAMNNAVTVTLPADGWFAYRVPATGATSETLGFFRPAPAAAMGMTSETVISSIVPGFVAASFMRSRAPGTASLSGAALDCMNRRMGGVELRVWVNGTRVVSPNPGAMTDPFIGYLTGTMSNMRAWTTTPDGTYVGGNIPVGATRMELWARQADGAEPTRIACEEFTSTANSVVVLSVPPLRNDYAEGSGCAN